MFKVVSAYFIITLVIPKQQFLFYFNYFSDYFMTFSHFLIQFLDHFCIFCNF